VLLLRLRKNDSLGKVNLIVKNHSNAYKHPKARFSWATTIALVYLFLSLWFEPR
jgi:hypothetical protein